MELKLLLENLKKPVSYKWKIQSVPKENKNKPWEWKNGNCVAYIDARDCMDTLDMYCEEGWQNEFYEVKGKVFCKVGIKINGEWLWKSDSWALEENENVEYETTSKGETSDAFKRACVQWGIGRFLYEKDIIWISHEEYEANRFKINEFCLAKEWKPINPKTTETPTGEKRQYARTEADDILDQIEIEDHPEHLKTLFAKLYPLGKSDAQKAFYKKQYEKAKKRIESNMLPWRIQHQSFNE